MTDEITAEQAAAAEGALLATRGVAAVEVTHRDQRLGKRTLEITIGPDAERVPPRVLKCLHDHDLGVRDVSPRASYRIVLAV